jgi:hypothetical protein
MPQSRLDPGCYGLVQYNPAMIQKTADPMTETTLSSILQGGDRRSLGRANSVVALILSQPARFPELIECLWSDDAIIRMRAADAAEKISAQKPQLLHPFKAELLGLAAAAS